MTLACAWHFHRHLSQYLHRRPLACVRWPHSTSVGPTGCHLSQASQAASQRLSLQCWVYQWRHSRQSCSCYNQMSSFQSQPSPRLVSPLWQPSHRSRSEKRNWLFFFFSCRVGFSRTIGSTGQLLLSAVCPTLDTVFQLPNCAFQATWPYCDKRVGHACLTCSSSSTGSKQSKATISLSRMRRQCSCHWSLWSSAVATWIASLGQELIYHCIDCSYHPWLH